MTDKGNLFFGIGIQRKIKRLTFRTERKIFIKVNMCQIALTARGKHISPQKNNKNTYIQNPQNPSIILNIKNLADKLKVSISPDEPRYLNGTNKRESGHWQSRSYWPPLPPTLHISIYFLCGKFGGLRKQITLNHEDPVI